MVDFFMKLSAMLALKAPRLLWKMTPETLMTRSQDVGVFSEQNGGLVKSIKIHFVMEKCNHHIFLSQSVVFPEYRESTLCVEVTGIIL